MHAEKNLTWRAQEAWRTQVCRTKAQPSRGHSFLESVLTRTQRLHAPAAWATCASRQPLLSFLALLFYSCCFLWIVPFLSCRPAPAHFVGLRSVVVLAGKRSLTPSLGVLKGPSLLVDFFAMTFTAHCHGFLSACPLTHCKTGRSYFISVPQYLAQLTQ